jgi:hypothetical protein
MHCFCVRRNFNWITKTSTKRKRKRRVAEAIARQPGQQDCVNTNQYVTHMLAVSLGLKLSDAGRRILFYTKARLARKSFYAICRVIFPIQELCGAMTSLALAERDLLGVNTPLWKLLAPAVVVHGMANFRGMKVRFFDRILWLGGILHTLTSCLYNNSPFSNGTRQLLGQKCNYFLGTFQMRRRFLSS